jgi:CheY-like chemotaxis protein
VRAPAEPTGVEIATLVVQALSSLAWPAVVALVLWMFREPLGRLLTSGSVTVKGPGGIEVSTTARAEAVSALQGAAAARQVPLAAPAAAARIEAGAAALAQRTTSPRILWVDPTPSVERLEREALTRLGMTVEPVTSTAAALSAVMRSVPYDLVVAAPDPAQEPMTSLRANGVLTPVVVYPAAVPLADAAMGAGALGATDHPAELLDLVVQALRRQPPAPAGG